MHMTLSADRMVARRPQGFSLIELVITMLIVAILAAIAIPGYNSYVRKSRRTEIKTALLDMASLEERYFSTNQTYSSTAGDLGYTAFPATLASGFYTISAPAVTAASVPTAATPGGIPAVFTLTGTYVAGTDQAKDTQCASFTVTSGGIQSATNSGGTDNTATCWR